MVKVKVTQGMLQTIDYNNKYRLHLVGFGNVHHDDCWSTDLKSVFVGTMKFLTA